MNKVDELRYRSRPVRIVILNSMSWWSARDVCALLGHASVQAALECLDSDDKQVVVVEPRNGLSEMLVVSEAGLFALIDNSWSSDAAPFKRWVNQYALPFIRNRVAGRVGTDLQLATLVRDMAVKIEELERRLDSQACCGGDAVAIHIEMTQVFINVKQVVAFN